MCFAPLFEKFMQAIFQTKKKSSLFFIRRRYAAEQAAAVAFGRQLGEKSPPRGGKKPISKASKVFVRKQVAPLIRRRSATPSPRGEGYI